MAEKNKKNPKTLTTLPYFCCFALFVCFVISVKYDLADCSKRKTERQTEIRKPPPSQEHECKALGCFLASCRGHCNGAAAT